MRRGYTLVEILISLGIIFLLAALVFSLLAPVRARARENTCINNLHQLGKAVRMYMDDWDAQEVVPGTRQTEEQVGFCPKSGADVFIKQYLGTQALLRCPAYRRTPIETTFTTYQSLFFILPQDDHDVKEMVLRERGLETPLFSCEWHNSDEIIHTPKPWDTQLILTLRLGLNVTRRRIPATQRSPVWW